MYKPTSSPRRIARDLACGLETRYTPHNADRRIHNPDANSRRNATHLEKSRYKILSFVLSLTSIAPAALATVDIPSYKPSPMEIPSWQIWVGFAAGVVPFAIASIEFGKRIRIQQRCVQCNGQGLVQRGRFLRKCNQCGGMLPWLGWKAFWFSNLQPGNGGPLLRPRGQTSVLYRIPPAPDVKEAAVDPAEEK